MQRLVLTLIFGLFFGSWLFAQGVLVTCQKSVHDFGVIKEKAGKVTHVFQIKMPEKFPWLLLM